MNELDKNQDLLDMLLKDWQRERPDLDSSSMEVVGRILYLGKKIEKQTSLALREFGIYYTDLDVLATLRRVGDPYELSPTELRKSVLITSGAMTALLDRLKKMGLLYRKTDPNDGRVSLAVLSEKGKNLIDLAIKSRFESAELVLSNLNPEEKKQLALHLKKLVLSLENQRGDTA